MTDDLAAITAFTEARLADDEADIRRDIPTDMEWYARFQPAAAHGRGREMAIRRVIAQERMLAGVESTRKLLAEIQAMPHDLVDGDVACQAEPPAPAGPCDCGRDARARRMLAAIAMRWSDHPDYLPGWAPAAVGG